MKFLFTAICFFICQGLMSQDSRGPIPAPKQLAWQAKPFYLFMHFGPNTFTDLEWGKGSEKEEIFNPTAMDCRQWCRIAKAAGASGIVITAKHHDGFCLWPSAFSNHTVAKSSWKNGKGDVLKELSAACREFGLSFGVYLSPWDRNHPSYGDPAYNDVFINMMKEVVHNYGPFFEFWWDGANGEGPNGKKQVYDWWRFEKTIREIMPNTVVFSDIGPDARWVGNEKGIAGTTNWNLLDTAGFTRGNGAPPGDTLTNGNVYGKNWIPAECDVSIRPGWFYHAQEDSLVKSPEQLFDIYMKSVGRGANLILNVPPDRRGLISESDSAALIGFARLRQESFGNSLLEEKHSVSLMIDGKQIEKIKDSKNIIFEPGKNYRSVNLEISFAEKQSVNCLLLKEKIQDGQQVSAFTIELFDGRSLKYQNSYTTIGSERIISFPTQKINRIQIRVNQAKAIPTISRIDVFHIPDQLVVQ